MAAQSRSRKKSPDPNVLVLAERLHSVAIHLLRRVRTEDKGTGLSPPKLSALSVLVFGGPRSLKELAAAEQVSPPTITKIVQDLEAEGLTRRETDQEDRRVIRVTATARGSRVLREGRTRRARLLATLLAELDTADRRTVADAVFVLEQIVRQHWSDAGNG